MNTYIDPNPNLVAINNRQYQLLDNVLKVRESFLKEHFWDNETIDRFIKIFSGFIDFKEVHYDPEGFSIYINIKKTSVKKMPNYRAESIFYYNAVGNTLMILLKEFKEKVINCLAKYLSDDPKFKYVNIYDFYFTITSDPSYVYNLVNVQCISDGVIQIVL